MKYYRVKTGFGDDEFISIDETEVHSAIRAQVTGKVGIFNEGTIAGNNIISILPDYNRAMGWNRDYKLNGEDYMHIGQQRQDDHRNLLTETKERVYEQVGGGTKLIGN